MPRKKTPDKQALKYRLETRVNEAKYLQLKALLDKSINMDMSRLLRDFLHNRPIKVYTHDRSLDMTMEELTKMRAEIRAIGVNINQITHQFNTYPEVYKKIFFGKIAMDQFISTQGKIDKILEIITKLSKRWL